ncbi:NHLP leader peptide family RiPP precursor [Chryseobacterium profundimaris]|uniref:NHLP leader peptide domain-containing protein n=1 Tax=Chryseobacterium profundimaris TaxID=1387275 RepID=A0ABY1P4I4_9FLAO|nr:NHLP leader peptide family RiPP precursor [Chryseobacterium profundimaris]SMP25798.1 NHLP leader peptide domain-containing protein [Chryseobacterium profundimaris]
MEITQEQKMYAEIVQKAWEDAEFKNELVNSPIEAIEKLTGKKLNLPEGKKIVVRDQTDESVFYINIPAKPSDDVELSDDQLEMVAGGMETGTIKEVVDFLCSFTLFSPK